MGLFGFKRKKDEKKAKTKEFIRLNRRLNPRYITQSLKSSLGEVIDISKDSFLAACELKEIEVGERVEFEIGDRKLEGEVVRTAPSKVAVKLLDHFEMELIKNHLAEVERVDFKKSSKISIGRIVLEDNLEKNRALINIMLEVDDPNTNIERFKDSIELLDELKEKILSRANSIEIAGVSRVDNVASAITRLGFEDVRKIVYDYIIYESNLDMDSLEAFEDYDIYNMIINRIFKRLAPLFNFNDIKNEGFSLLSVTSVGAVLLEKECWSLLPFYSSAKRLFSLEMRLFEKKECGYDLYEIGREYFVKKMGFFDYLFDGSILAQFMITPHYKNDRVKITLSQRKLRYAYVAYLTVLAASFLMSKDKTSGFRLYHRLRRLGFSSDDVKKWLDELVVDMNRRLTEIGHKKRLLQLEIPSAMENVDRYLGKSASAGFFKSVFSKFEEDAERLVVRCEDTMYGSFVLDKLLNSEFSSLNSLSFCVIPCENLEDEDLQLSLFEGFDLVVFKDIHALKKDIQKDFGKIWRDFEGKIICTISNEAFMEYENPDMFDMLNPFMVDFPSYFKNPALHQNMTATVCESVNSFFEKDLCHIEDFKEGLYDMYSVYVKCFEKVG